MPRPKKLPYHAGGREPPRDSPASRAWSVRRNSPIAKAFDTLEAAIGGRDAVVEALAVSDLTDDQRYLFGLIADPRNDARSLAQICSRSGYTIGALLQVFKDAKLAKAQVQAIVKVADKLPAVAEDVMALAVSKIEPCRACKGTGELPGITGKDGALGPPRECGACGGDGATSYTPSVERQKLALDIGGLYRSDRPGGSVQVGVQVNAAAAPLSVTQDYLRDMRMGTDRLLYPGRDRTISADTSDVVDVEAVPAPAPVTTPATAPATLATAPAAQETEAKQLLIPRSAPVDQAPRSTQVPNQPFLAPPGRRPS